jgi:peptidoglycan/LPS O-acetylase OafA/YrhL
VPSPSAPPYSSAPSAPSSSPLGYLPALDGLRALAVAAVVVYHLGYSRVPGGYIGVEVFFVLSGWLVCALLAAEHRARGGIDLKAFWLRRARRLLPAVSLVVGVTLVVALQARYHHFATLRGDGLAALGYVLNWRLIVDQKSYFAAAAAGPSPLQHLWSLSIEEQFYLALPLLLGLALAGRRTARRVALLALGAAVVATAWRLAVDAPGGDPSRLYYGTDTRAAGLLVGAALALVWVPSRLRPVPGRWAGPLLDLVALASLAVLGWYTLEVDERSPDAFGWSLTVVQIASLTLIAVVVHPVRGLVARAMALGPLRWIGRRSYGIYLWHWPLIGLLAKAPGEQPSSPSRAATIVVATLVIAAVSYRLVEQPIREHGVADALSLARRWTARHIAGRPVLTAAVTALAIVGYVGGVLLARDIVAADDITGETPPTALAPAGSSGDDSAEPGTADGAPHDCPPGAVRTEAGTGRQTAPADPSPTNGTDATTASETGADAGAGAGDRATANDRGGCRSEAGGSGIDVAGATPPAVVAGPPPVPPADPVGAAAPGLPGDPAAGMAAPGPVPAPAPVLPWTTAIGDSVMQGAAPALQARFGPQLVLEATVGFQMVDAPELVQRLADEGRLGDVVVLHLGANGPFPDEVIDEIVAIAGRRPVLLVNVKVPRRWEAEVNDRIAAAAERHPRVAVVDWRTVSESEEGLLWRDGHHLTPAGAERYADLIASYAAATGD